MTLAQYISLIDVQARLALKADASKYFLGYIWWVMEPLLFVAVFYVVFQVFLQVGEPDFLIFLMCGKLPFMWFSKTVTLSSNSLIAAVGLIGRTDIPKEIFPLSLVQEGLYKQSTVFLLLFAVLYVYGFTPNITWWWLLPILLVNYLIIVACSLIGSVLVCWLKDFALFISLGILFLMFTSGIFWNVRSLPDPHVTELILTFNPMAYIVDAYRQVLMHGVVPDSAHLFAIALVFAGVSAATVWLMRRQSEWLALKVITA